MIGETPPSVTLKLTIQLARFASLTRLVKLPVVAKSEVKTIKQTNQIYNGQLTQPLGSLLVADGKRLPQTFSQPPPPPPLLVPPASSAANGSPLVTDPGKKATEIRSLARTDERDRKQMQTIDGKTREREPPPPHPRGKDYS